MLKRRVLIFLLLLAVPRPAAAEATPPGAVMKMGDFYYSADGALVGARHVDLPADFVRRPMSHKEQFEMLGLKLPERSLNSLKPLRTVAKPSRAEWHKGLRKDKVEVKFVEGMRVRMRDGQLRLVSPDGATFLERTEAGDLAAFEAVQTRFPEAQVRRLHSTEERILDDNKLTGELIGGRQLPDLNNWYLFEFPEPTDRAVDLVNELLQLPEVETAYLLQEAEPPVCADAAPVTPLWEANQNYLNPAPDGVDAEYAWTYHAGGNGYSTFWVIDLEWQWCYGHEDLDILASDVVNGDTGNNTANMNHGTAVLGEFGACDNAYGMTGISNEVNLKMADFDSEPSWASNISTADSYLFTGEVMLLEIHIGGPNSGLVCVCNCDQFEYVPVEWNQASFDEIQTATANGTVVVEAGGNGSMNLDSGIYGGAFDLNNRDSGAILVAAGTNNAHAPECWTNYGSRIDVHAYGDNVFSTGYGGWWSQTGCTQDYTSTFSGTSSASPIITGVCAVLQGIANQKYGYDLTASQMRNRIKVGGTPQAADPKDIGVMPDLFDAINGIEPDVAEYFAAGWSYPVVPRSTNDSNSGSVPLQAGALPGNVAGTYWNWATRNWSSYSPTLNSPHTMLYRDDTAIWECLHGNFAALAWGWCGNVGGPDVVKGGRHTIRTRADWNDVEDESSETNNEYTRQFIWSGLPVALGAVAVTRTGDPPATSTGWGPWYNADGVSGTTGAPWMSAFAVMPVNAGDDHDILLNTEVPMNIPQQGFGSWVASSFGPAGEVEFVVVDRFEQPAGTYYASLLNFTGSGAGDRVVEWDGDNGDLVNPGTSGPFTMLSNNIIELHIAWLDAAAGQYRIHVDVTSGTADIGVSVFNTLGGFFGKTNTLPGGYADNNGAGQDEFVIVDPDDGGAFCVAVWKKNSASRTASVTYNIIISQDPNLVHATPTGWYGPVVPRNTTDATPVSAPLPATLNGNQTTTSYNFSTYNEGANSAVANPYWRTFLYLDDFLSWNGQRNFATPLPAGQFAQWINSAQGLDPYSLVRGGRHHLRLEADAETAVTEFSEADNTYVEAFIWTPLDLANQVPVVRNEPPKRDPLGYSWFSCDGFRSTPVPAGQPYWTAVGILPVNAPGDYDIRMHDASTGSKNGFDASYALSSDGPGLSDFSIANYRVATRVARDYGVIQFTTGTGRFVIQRADGFLLGTVNASQVFGPFSIQANDVLDFHEVQIGAPLNGVPLYVTLLNDVGTANLGIAVYSGATAFNSKLGYMANANVNGDGADEVIGTVALAAPAYYGIAVYKNGSSDVIKTGTYRIVISTIPVGVEDGDVRPAAFALTGAQPNPFGRSTQIHYDVPASGERMSLVVYNVNGQRVKTLVDGVVPVGRHVTAWDGADDGGRQAPSGIYFVRLESKDVRLNRKITLLR